MTNFQSYFGGSNRFFDIFLLSDSGCGGVQFLRRIAQSKVEFKRLLLSYLEHETDISNYLNEHDQVGRISEKSRFEFKKIFFEKFKIFKISKCIWIFSNIFENFRTRQNRFIVVGFQLTIFCTLASNL